MWFLCGVVCANTQQVKLDVLAGEIDSEESGGCGFCVVLCVPTPSR